jgi:hemerythrin-like domain-containing protein
VAAIGELTREHDAVVALVSRVREARRDADVPRMAGLARRIARVLGPHTQVEELGLFPAMAVEFPGHIAALEAEHRTIEAVLDEAADTVPADPAWPERLMDVLALLREHILKEQDGVFPAALATLSTEQWEAVEAARSRAGAAASPPAA